jgi:hypothetical protein
VRSFVLSAQCCCNAGADYREFQHFVARTIAALCNWEDIKLEIPETGLRWGEVEKLLRDKLGHVSD